MSAIDRIKEFLYTKMIVKGLKAGLVALAASKGLALLAAHGINISVDPDAAAAAAVALFHAGVNWYKNRNAA